MPDIDINKIKPGDTVRVRFQSSGMGCARIEPIEYTTTAYGPSDDVCVGGYHVEHSFLTILEHIPARLDWADARVVRDKDGDLWGRYKQGYFCAISRDSTGLSFPARALNDRAPITVVLDADGNPPEPEPEWLDADALDKLPEWTVILPDGGGQPRYRDHLGHWRLIGAAGGTLSESAAPARVLWAPERDR